MKRENRIQQQPERAKDDCVYTYRMFAKDARKSTLFKQVQKLIKKEDERKFDVRRDIDWTILGHQVIGSEKY